MKRLKYDFVLITPGRSGSEHLLETLNHFDDVHVSGEIFNRANFGPESFNAFLKTKKKYRILAYFVNREKLSGFGFNYALQFLIRRFLWNPQASNTNTTGFKLTLDQWQAYPYVMKLMHKAGCKVIYLYRHDTVAQVLSLMKARESGLYEARHKEQGNDQGVQKRYFDIKTFAKLHRQMRLAEDDLLSSYADSNWIHLTYEELFDTYPEHMTRIRSHLMLPKKTIRKYADLRKINPQPLKEWVENIEEIWLLFRQGV